MRIKHLIAVVVIVVVGLLVVVALIPSEEKRIKKQFQLLSDWVSKSPEENALALLQRMKNIGNLFDEDCEIKIQDPSLSGRYTRQEIASYAGSVRSYASQLDLKFCDFRMIFPENEIANINVTARVTGRSTAGERIEETRELECVLRKINEQWLFSRIEAVEVLKK